MAEFRDRSKNGKKSRISSRRGKEERRERERKEWEHGECGEY